MGTINLRIDDDLKARSYAVLDRLGVTPSELLRQTLEYVAAQERLPFRTTVVTEDELLLADQSSEPCSDVSDLSPMAS
jgi:RHH-type rel operon transcriptional repressor/antitoxin RelB